MALESIYLDNDYFVEVLSLTAKSVANGNPANQTGLVDVTAFLATTGLNTATTIHAEVSIVLTEGGSANYRGVLQGDKITTHVGGLTSVWVHIKRQQDFHVAEQVSVIDPRVP